MEWLRSEDGEEAWLRPENDDGQTWLGSEDGKKVREQEQQRWQQRERQRQEEREEQERQEQQQREQQSYVLENQREQDYREQNQRYRIENELLGSIRRILKAEGRDDMTLDDVAKAFRTLAVKYHPDKHPDSPDEALKSMKVLNEVYERLVNILTSKKTLDLLHN
ncbi:hypothetical protein AGMMS49592_3310 [Endomicrobiia bacterium]|nr:hypothetical protein AGMMS49592_3310 [Endomicrobiia bacterium]